MSEPTVMAEQESATSRTLGRQIRLNTDRMVELNSLLPFLEPYRWKIFAAAIVLTFTASLSLTMPIFIGQFVDNFGKITGDNSSGIFGIAMIVAALLAVGSGLRYALVTMVGERVVADIRKAVFAKAVSLSPAYYERMMTGEVLSRINTDTTLVLTVISSTVSVALRNMLIFAGGLALMTLTSAELTFLALLVVPVVIVPTLLLARRLRNVSRENQDLIAESSANASEILLSLQTVQANTHEEQSQSQFNDIVEQSIKSAFRRIRIRGAMTILIILLAFCGVVAVVWRGTVGVQTGQMTAGDLTQFVIYSVMVAGSVAALSEVWGELVRAAGATERLVMILDAEDTIIEPIKPISPRRCESSSIRFDNVTFQYPMRPTISALKNVSFSVRSGETVAIVGPSGSGKSTIFQLLLRFFDPQTGQILIDGINIREMRLRDFRQKIAFVPQDPAIFADTARNNIRFGRQEATDAEVEAAASFAAIHDFLLSLPKGYDSEVGERGIMLSGGQKQRVAIARAILRSAQLLLLDEATSSLDSKSEKEVQAAIEVMAHNRTTLIVAHRLSTVKNADRILVFDHGEIVAEGRHEDLIQDDGLYARLAELQFVEI